MIRNDISPSPERLFKERGPFFHVCSKPVECILLLDDDDRKTALLYLALAAFESSVVILAYAIMSNHIHVLIAGDAPEKFYRIFMKRMNVYLSRHGDRGRKFTEEPTIVPVNTLMQFMNVTAYVIRNQYVVDQNVNPVSHIWNSGYLYFNPVMGQLLVDEKYTSAEALSVRKVREITHSKESSLPPGSLKFRSEFPAPSSFVDYRLVENLFSCARQFVAKVFRNVEGQIETAMMLGETPVISDEEMSRLMWKYSSNEWGVQGIRNLSPAQRINLAKHMKYALLASNGQISRITLIPRKDVDALFPNAR